VGRKLNNTIKIVLLISWIVVIFVLTGYPGLQTPHLEKYPIDKVYHFILFLVLGMLEYRTLRTSYFFIVGGIVVLFAECQQIFIPGRAFELLDIVAGFIGLCFAYIVFKGYGKIRHAVSKT
jgi:VanZ family protein